MIKDAKEGQFDLVVTREVCRFARNNVDCLHYTRELKKYGVEVYFVSDNIWTMDNDGELRLSIMAALAQDESRKISERVKAGQKISREKGVLYGSGNILGYDRVGKTYVINPEQAETVRMIFNMYASGMGEMKITKELMRLHRKCGNGTVSWECSKVGRILKNATYRGLCTYGKYYSSDFLEQKRMKNTDESTYEYKEGDFEAIIDDELWGKVQKLREQKSAKYIGPDGKRVTFGKQVVRNVFSKKLRCVCGSTFLRRKWRTLKNGKVIYAYQCRRAVEKGNIKFRQEHDLPIEGFCEGPMLGDWKLQMMAYKVFTECWRNRKNAVRRALEIFQQSFAESKKEITSPSESIKRKIAALNRKIEHYMEMYADELVSKETMLEKRKECQEEIDRLQESLNGIQREVSAIDSKMDIEKILNSMTNLVSFEGEMVPEDIIDKFVNKIIVENKHHFKWYLSNELQDEEKTLYSIMGKTLPEGKEMPPVMTYTIKLPEATEYHMKNYGVKTHPEAWNDITIDIYL